MKSKTRIWTAVGAVWLALGVVDYATNGALSGEHHAAAAADEPTATHSTITPRATPSAKPKTVKAAVDTIRLNKLRHSGDDGGAYCTVTLSASRNGTLHLAATLGDRATTGTVVVDAQTASGGNWSDSYELVSARAQDDPANAGMALTHQWGTSLRLSDVTVITAQLSPDDDSSSKLYDCAVAPMPTLGASEGR